MTPSVQSATPALQFSLPPQPSALFGVRKRVRTYLQLSPLGPHQIDEVVLCVEEACTNAIRHSGVRDDVEISLSFEGADLVLVVKDKGSAFDLSRFDPTTVPDLTAEGGRGLFIMSELMDELDLRIADGLEVRMRKRGSGDPDAPQYRLADLIDVPELQELMDSFNASFSCPNAIIDSEANVITASGWQDVCTQFHRLHPDTLGECKESDLHIYGRLQQGKEAVSYLCPRGMIDCASPIIIEGRHLGNVFIGQVFVETPDLEAFRRQARHFGFDEEAYLDAVRRVPVLTREEFERRLPFVRALAEMIAELGLARLRDRTLHRELEARAAENAKLYEQQRRIAETLQQSMMHDLPVVPGLELGLVSRTAHEPELVGGDFHDVFPLPDGRILAVIGDVEGKGVHAAGLAETVRGALRALSLTCPGPDEILRQAGHLLGGDDAGHLVSALAVTLDPSTGRCIIASAGHPPAVRFGLGRPNLVELRFGPLLGSFEGPYAATALSLAPGEGLLLYTDGVTEARRRGGSVFSESRLLDAVAAAPDLDPARLVEHLQHAVLTFASELLDDLQMLALRRV